MTDLSMEIPKHAIERLKGLRGQGHPGGIFTSDFSVNEFLLVRKAGFEPIGLCIGSCVYHLGLQYAGWSSNQELTTLSQAMYHARELAMSRMREEARDMGADGIVGVQPDGQAAWSGTIIFSNSWRSAPASSMPRAIPAIKGPKDQPFTSDLSGPGFLDAAAGRLPAARDGDGQLRLSRRASGPVPVAGPGRAAMSR